MTDSSSGTHRVRRSAALAASAALTRTKPADAPHALRQLKPPARKRTRAQPASKTQSTRQANLAPSAKKRAKPSNRDQKRCAGSAPPRKRKREREREPAAGLDQRHDRSSAASAADAAAESSPASTEDGATASVDAAVSAGIPTAAAATALPRARALSSPLPDMVITPGLRDAVDASRSRHEAAFVAEKKVRAPDWCRSNDGRAITPRLAVAGFPTTCLRLGTAVAASEAKPASQPRCVKSIRCGPSVDCAAAAVAD